MPLDFKRAAALFLGSEEELAMALGIPVDEVRSHRREPGRVPPPLLARMGRVLIERGRGMVRVGEMLSEEATGAEGNGGGAS
jgi:hypothetical protein